MQCSLPYGVHCSGMIRGFIFNHWMRLSCAECGVQYTYNIRSRDEGYRVIYPSYVLCQSFSIYETYVLCLVHEYGG